MVGGAKRYVDQALAPLMQRLADAEKRAADAEQKIADVIAKAVAALPRPQDGRSVTAEDIVPLIEERLPAIVSEAVRAIPVPKDGADGRNGTDGVPGKGIAKLLIDAKGNLVATFTDGSTDEVGLIVGKDGSNGRDGADGKEGAPGKSGADGKEGAEGPAGRDGADGKDGQDGKSIDIETVADMVRAEVERIAPDLVQKAVDAIPRPADGKDGQPGERGEKGEAGEPGREGAKGTDGADGAPGKSVTPDDVRPILAELVDTAVKALPVPKDGRSVTVEDVEPLIAKHVTLAVSEAAKAIPVPKDGKDGRDGADGAAGEKGADGINGRDGLDAVTPILKDGVLLFTMSDGTVKEVGAVLGKDGKDGKDGAAGKDGADGLGFDDLDVAFDGERSVSIKFQRGDQVKEFPLTLPIVLDRGVWQERGMDGGGYKQGDGVSWGGSFYIARKDTFAKPDDFDAWRLSVKRGKDAREPVNLK